jgi:uncharacterized protein YndB with AHSA1/START domain
VKAAAERREELGRASASIVKEIYIEAPPEMVFEFLTDPKKIARWLGMRAELESCTRKFRVGQHMICGTYLGIIPNRRVVFTWKSERIDQMASTGTSSVEIELHREGHRTRLRWSHRVSEVEARHSHERGGSHYMDRLKAACEGRDLGLGEDPSGVPLRFG